MVFLQAAEVLVTAQTVERLPIQLKRRTMCLTKQHHHSEVVLRCRRLSLPAHQLHRLFKKAPTYQRLVFLYLIYISLIANLHLTLIKRPWIFPEFRKY